MVDLTGVVQLHIIGGRQATAEPAARNHQKHVVKHVETPMESQWAHIKIAGIYIGIAMYSPIVGSKKPLKIAGIYGFIQLKISKNI